MTKTYDVAVIGAGIQGCSTAYYCTKAGLKVAVLEQGDIAEKSSSHSNGNITYTSGDPGHSVELCIRSIQLITDELTRELDYDYEWNQCGCYYLCENETELEMARDLSRRMNDYHQIETKVLDPKELRELAPGVADDIVGAYGDDTDGTLYSIGLSFGLYHKAQQLGCDFYLNSPVISTKAETDGSFTLVNSNGDVVKAAKVVNCGGVWANQLGQMVGLEVPIIPRQGMIVVSERGWIPSNTVLMEYGYRAIMARSDYDRGVTKEMDEYGVAMAYQPTYANNFLLGASRRFVGYDFRTDPDVLRCIVQRALRFFPTIRNINMIRSYTGLRPITPDNEPIISETTIPGYYVCAGHEGEGIILGPISGKLISQQITGQPTDMDVSHFRYSRFLK